ncbi:TonB-dependent receptor [Allopontixanthobacter sediminis]|uniref:TonB-dependent siderophore receptor n=1 Tax=Allopontixanthobacter sediminis TaxID=1689985 RepID=A0A845AZB2_9SPHN|nr:TonB-dependent receptor [Allopontixanthobacter sediminis]MXP43214.1 TonB-dependent siderophore receptor [Allopontixanthobacter sediminis]
MKLRLAYLPASAILAALAVPAAAQDEDAATIVVTAQRDNATEIINGGDAGVLGNKPAEDLPFSIRSFDETLIYNQQPLTIGDVLDNDPTVRTTYGFGNAAEQFVIRGFALFGDDVGVNGLYGIAPRQLIAPELFGEVQVLNGASAFLNGAAPGGSGLGGSVNLKLKRAAPQDLNRVTVGFVGDGHLGASFDTSRRFGSGGEFGVRINGAYRDGEVSVDREDRRTQVLGAAFDYDSGPFRAALDLAYQEVRVDALRPKVNFGTAIPAVPDADANYAQDYTFTELRDIFGTLSLEYDLSPGAMLYARAGARDGREDGIYGGITVLDTVTGDANGNALFVPRTDNNEAVEAGFRGTFATGGISHEVNLGGSMNWQTNRNAYDFLYGPGFAGFATNLYDTPQVAIPSSTLVGGDLDDPFPIAESRLSSLFASDTIGLWDERILLTGGLRYQKIHVNSFSYFGGGLDTTYDEDRWTPAVGLVIKPAQGLSLYANYIEALQQGPTAPIDPALANPGEILAPRVSEQFEIGGKLALGPVFATLALYRIERPGEGLITDGGEQRFGYIGDERHEGVELTLNGEVTPGLRLISGLAFNNAEFDNGSDVPGVPEFTFNANAEWDLPFIPGATLTGRVTHTGEQAANAANTLTLEDWTVVDLGARYVFAAGDNPVTLRLTVDNVFDEAYWASAFDVFNPALLQGAPHTVKASASISF